MLHRMRCPFFLQNPRTQIHIVVTIPFFKRWILHWFCIVLKQIKINAVEMLNATLIYQINIMLYLRRIRAIEIRNSKIINFMREVWSISHFSITVVAPCWSIESTQVSHTYALASLPNPDSTSISRSRRRDTVLVKTLHLHYPQCQQFGVVNFASSCSRAKMRSTNSTPRDFIPSPNWHWLTVTWLELNKSTIIPSLKRASYIFNSCNDAANREKPIVSKYRQLQERLHVEIQI